MRQILVLFVICGVLDIAEGATDTIESEESLHKKCLVELKYQFVPSNCFIWIKRSTFNSSKKAYLREWFTAVCRKAMKKDESQVQYHVHRIGEVSKECQQSMEEAFVQWSYKSKSEDPEKIMKLMVRPKVGRDLEYSGAYDLEKTKRNRNHRGAGRRLN